MEFICIKVICLSFIRSSFRIFKVCNQNLNGIFHFVDHHYLHLQKQIFFSYNYDIPIDYFNFFPLTLACCSFYSLKRYNCYREYPSAVCQPFVSMQIKLFYISFVIIEKSLISNIPKREVKAMVP